MSARLIRLRARAPAKVNLVLRVGPLRPDGYHELETLMVLLSLADEVRVTVRPGRPGEVRCRAPGRPELDGPANLAARAAEAFRRRFGIEDGIELEVMKRVPVTAGLGGGSSDAAAVLRALSRAYRLRDRRALAELALAVGSDVPFFLGAGAAWARGRGEALTPARVEPLHLALLYPTDPALAIRAGDAYAWLDAWRVGRPAPPAPARGGELLDVSEEQAFHRALLWNDLEAPCAERHPELDALRHRLLGLGALAAMMSGSGPTVFGIFRDGATARRAARRAQGDGIVAHAVRTVQRHPGVIPWTSPRSASYRVP